MARQPVDVLSSTQLAALCRVGVVGNLTDRQLVESFLTGPEPTAQASFAALVDRHGPMVLRVCRQILGNAADAEDAFQATFLVLVRRAGSVRKRDLLACWLYGIALRVAQRSRVDEARRRAHERRWAAMASVNHIDSAVEPESWPELHEELGRLPEKYREPVVLCYLEGLSTQAAAQRLGCAQGTILSRLSRAREQLRKKMTHRGLLVPAGLMAAGLATTPAEAAVPPTLAHGLVEAAVASLLRKGVGSASISASALQLTRGVLRTMFFTRLMMSAAVVVTVAALTAGALFQKTSEPRPVTTQTTSTPAEKAATPTELMKHPMLRETSVVPKDLAWAVVPREEWAKILDMLVASSRANYQRIKTWSGTYHHDTQVLLPSKFVSSFPLAPPNSGPLMQEREATVKFAIDQDSILFLDERTIQQATFKPGTRQIVTKPKIQAMDRCLCVLQKDSYVERYPLKTEVVAGPPGQANVVRRPRQAIIRAVEDGRRSTERIDPRFYFGRPGTYLWSRAEWLAQKLRDNSRAPSRRSVVDDLTLWRAEGPGGSWYWQLLSGFDPRSGVRSSESTVWSPQAGYNPVLYFNWWEGPPWGNSKTEWTWTRFDDTYLPTDHKQESYEDGKNLSFGDHAKLEDCLLNKPLDPEPDTIDWLELTDGDRIVREGEQGTYKVVQEHKLVAPE